MWAWWVKLLNWSINELFFIFSNSLIWKPIAPPTYPIVSIPFFKIWMCAKQSSTNISYVNRLSCHREFLERSIQFHLQNPIILAVMDLFVQIRIIRIFCYGAGFGGSQELSWILLSFKKTPQWLLHAKFEASKKSVNKIVDISNIFLLPIDFCTDSKKIKNSSNHGVNQIQFHNNICT